MIAGPEAEYQLVSELTKDTPYLALTGELWGVFCEYLWENLLCYNGTALYLFLLLTLDTNGAVFEESASLVFCSTRVVVGIRRTQIVDR